MTPQELKENFTNQFNTIVDEIGNLESQLTTKKEMALKLKGALEALSILEPSEAVEPSEQKPEE
ncbi:hypothetical protein EB001_02760 [bacterium]|nr:hypothetical protein [bacterium]